MKTWKYSMVSIWPVSHLYLGTSHFHRRIKQWGFQICAAFETFYKGSRKEVRNFIIVLCIWGLLPPLRPGLHYSAIRLLLAENRNADWRMQRDHQVAANLHNYHQQHNLCVVWLFTHAKLCWQTQKTPQRPPGRLRLVRRDQSNCSRQATPGAPYMSGTFGTAPRPVS